MATNLPPFSSHKNPSPQELKRFRAAVSRLKKQGLLPKGISAKTARPSWVRKLGPKGGRKTLAEFVNGAASTLPSTPKSKLAQKPFSIRDFATNQKTLATLFRDIEKDDALAAKFDAMKRPDERWAFRINKTDSIHSFPDIRLLIDEAFHYEHYRSGALYGTKDVFHNRTKSKNLFGKLQIIRWTKGDTEWKKQRKFPTQKKRVK